MHKFHQTGKKLSLLSIAIAAVCSGGVVAQDQPNDDELSFGLEEIVVTARRREESIQDTPISIAAFGDGELEARGLRDLQSMVGYIPNVNIGSNGSWGSSGADYTIRGAGQGRNSVTLESGIGLYIDGVFIGRSEASLSKFGDVERVEVLRGPQGTLFGKNSSGGAISITTKKPHDSFEAQVELGFGRFDRTELMARVNVPLADTVFSKFTVFNNDRDGSVIRSDGLDVGDTNEHGARAQFRFEPSSDLSIDVSVDYSDLDRNGPALVARDIDPTQIFPFLLGVLNPGVNPPFDDRWVPDDPTQRTFGTGPTAHELESWGGSVEVNWNLGDLDFKSITAYRGYDFLIAVDGDGTPVQMFHQMATRDFDQFSQEFQLSGQSFGEKLNWVAGLYYFTENPSEEREVNTRGIGSFGRTEQFSYDQETLSYAAYTQGTFAITDRLSATLGVRYSYDDKELTLAEPSRFGDLSITGEEDFDSFTPRFDLQYQWTDEIMTYASYSEGFKGGGINDRIIGVDGGGFTDLPFDDERSETFEIGFRSQLLDNRIRLNATIFQTTYTDLQQAFLIPDPAIPGRNLVLTENVGEAEVDGAEIDVILALAPGFTVNASYGYMDTEITELNADALGPFALGDEIARSPENSYVLGAQYVADFSGGGSLLFRLDYSWTDEFKFGSDPVASVNPSSSLVNGQIRYDAEKWSLALIGNNLTNEVYFQNSTNFSVPFGFEQAEAINPRDWTIRGTYNF